MAETLKLGDVVVDVSFYLLAFLSLSLSFLFSPSWCEAWKYEKGCIARKGTRRAPADSLFLNVIPFVLGWVLLFYLLIQCAMFNVSVWFFLRVTYFMIFFFKSFYSGVN